MSFLAKSDVECVSSIALNSAQDIVIKNDNVIMNLSFKDGSIGTSSYLANGNKSYSKEKMTLFCEGKIFELDNYKKVDAYGGSGIKKWSQDKGHKNEILAFLENVQKSTDNLIALNSLINTTLTTSHT